MDLDRTVVDVLAPAVAAARRALLRLDPEEIPASVLQVVRKGDGRLPPPLVRSLLSAIDDDAWLREKAAEEAPDDGPAHLYLRRPDGWEEALVALADERGGRVAERRDERAEQRVAATERQLAAANERIDHLRRQVRDAEQREAEARASTQAAVRSATETTRAETAAARREADELRQQLVEVGGQLADAERRLARAQADLLQERRAREDAVTPSGSSHTWAGDGARLAEHIDDLHAAARARVDSWGPERLPVTSDSVGTDAAVRAPLPIGVRPDEAEAIDALIGWRGTVYIDGYNLSAELGVSPANPTEGRAAVRRVVDRITARGTRAPEVVVVYDTTQGSEERRGEVFVSDADAELRRLAAEDPVRTVVVSDDREVIEGVHAAGATAVWSDAVVDWVRQRR